MNPFLPSVPSPLPFLCIKNPSPLTSASMTFSWLAREARLAAAVLRSWRSRALLAPVSRFSSDSISSRRSMMTWGRCKEGVCVGVWVRVWGDKQGE